jgi:dienelactone hydrolase
VSGRDAYVEGEYLFQDFVYDDNGANTTPTGDSPNPAPDSHAFGPMSGDVVYPDDSGREKAAKKYVNNAADLLEFRTRLTGDGRVHYRFTLTTMRKSDVAAVALGIDTGGLARETDWGYGLGDLGAPVDTVLVTWGEGAELDGQRLADLPGAGVDVSVDHNQIDVVLPLQPDGETWRHYLVTGLWDGEAGAFKQIRDQPTADEPGGARGQDPPPVFNVGFRYDEQEPIATPNAEPETIERQAGEAVEEATASRGVGYGHWRDHAQSKALAARDISQFHADVDFDRVADGDTQVNVPETGYLDRIYVSNYTIEDETNPPAGIGPFVTEDGDDNNGEDVIRGHLVPYAIFVPDSYDGTQFPFHVHLHSLSGTYNQYRSWTPNFIRQLGAARDTIIVTTTGRGPGVPYDDQAELDVFEAWNDAAGHYAVDFDRVTIGGYSMGGIGTHRLASKWPDLFARGYSIAGSLGGENTDEAFGDDLYKNQERIAINQRHVPLLIWQGPADELAPFPLAFNYHQHLRDLGLRHEFDFFPAADHLSFGYLDEWGPAAEFLDGATVERRPPRITYRRVPELDNDTLDLVHDRVYWVSGIRAADDVEDGLLDVRSLGFGEAEPVVARYEREGTEPKPHVKRGVEWKEPLTAPAPKNVLEVELEDVVEATVWIDEAELDATRPLTIRATSTRAATLVLESAFGTLEVEIPAGESEQTVQVCGEAPEGRPRVDVARSDDGTVFRTRQTNTVDLRVDADRPVRLRDRVPEGWTVDDGDPHEVYTEDGIQYVEFTGRVRSGTRRYFARTPWAAEESGSSTFGPVEVNLGDGWVALPETTDTNVVVPGP